jgi:hypothetical protein
LANDLHLPFFDRDGEQVSHFSCLSLSDLDGGFGCYFDDLVSIFLKGLILAQNERWRRGLGMQVEREFYC